MKNSKRFLAICGIILLVGLYVSTLVCALLGVSDLFRALIYAIVVLPVLIWTYVFIYKLLRKRNSDEPTDNMKKN